jgi:hypothetical protein
VGKTTNRFRGDRYDENDYGYKETKQRRRDKLELKRFKNYNVEYYENDPYRYKDKKQRRAA